MQRVRQGVSPIGWPTPSFAQPPLGVAWRFDSDRGFWLGNAGAGNVIIPPGTTTGAPYGTALAVEAAPVAFADVPASRRLTVAPTSAGIPTSGSTVVVRSYGFGVSSGTMSIAIWLWEAAMNTWLPFATPAAQTFTAIQYVAFTAAGIPLPSSSYVHVSVSANAANAPYLAVMIQ